MFTENDSTQCWNLVRALKKGKFELDGEEVIAFSKMFQWVSNLCLLIDADVKNKKLCDTPDSHVPIVQRQKGRKK